MISEEEAIMKIDYRTFLETIERIGYHPVNVMENKIGIALGEGKVEWIPFTLEWNKKEELNTTK